MGDEPEFISFAEFARRTSLCRATIYNMIARGEIPAPLKLSPRRVAWPVAEYNAWVASLQRASLAEIQSTEEDS